MDLNVESLVEKLWTAGARTRKYPKRNIRDRIKAKWERILKTALEQAKKEAWVRGQRIIILESPTRCLMQSFDANSDEVFYTVDIKEGICTCPHFMDFAHDKEPCKHQKMFAAMVGKNIYAAVERARAVPLPPSPRKIIGLSAHLRHSAAQSERYAHGG